MPLTGRQPRDAGNIERHARLAGCLHVTNRQPAFPGTRCHYCGAPVSVPSSVERPTATEEPPRTGGLPLRGPIPPLAGRRLCPPPARQRCPAFPLCLGGRRPG